MKLISGSELDEALSKAYKELAKEFGPLPVASDAAAYHVVEPVKWKDYEPGPLQYYGMDGMKNLYKNNVLTEEEISLIYSELKKHQIKDWIVSQVPDAAPIESDAYIESANITLSYGTVSYTDMAYPNPLNFEASHDLVEGPAIAECQFCYHKYLSRSNKTCPKCGAVNPNLRKRTHEQRQQQK